MVIRPCKIVRFFCLVMLSQLLLLTGARGQFSQGWIFGQVRDYDGGRLLADVEVTLKSAERVEEPRVVTDASGNYYFLAVLPGIYRIEFQKVGYLTYGIQKVEVQSGRASIAKLEMQRGLAGAREISWSGESASWGISNGGVFERRRLENLPSPRNIWALLENQDLSSVTNRVDEGGLATGLIALAGSRGSSWTQNGYRLDGINVTDPYDTGKPLIYPDYGGLEEFCVEAGSHPAALAFPGASFQMTSRRGGRQRHLQGEGYYLGEPFQSSHLDARLRRLDFAGAERFRRFGEGQFLAGGPVPRFHKWFFFSSLYYQRLSKIVPDFAEVPTTSVYSAFLRVDGNLRHRDSLSLSAAGQIINHSHLGARRKISPSATLFANDRFEVVQGHWRRRQSDDTLWQIRGGFSHTSPTDTFHHGIQEPNRLQLFTEEMTGGAPIEADSARSRFSLLGHAQMWRRALCGGCRHLLDFGTDLEESLSTEERRVFQDIQLLYYPKDVPTQVIQYNTPSRTKVRLREWSLFVDDHLQVFERLFVRFGLALDGSQAFLPQQRSGSGTFVPARESPGAKGVVSWRSLAPRVSFALALPRRLGGPRVYAGYSRYYHMLPARYANYANPLSVGGRVFQWQDGNHDGRFQPGEEGTLLRVFGGPYSSVDPRLRRPLTDEWGLGLEQSLGRQFSISARLFRRDEKRLVETVNIGIPKSAFSSLLVSDLGDDNVPGTSDDRSITVWNQDPRTLGEDRFLLTNPAGFRSFYKGIEMSLWSRWLQRGFIALSFTAYKTVGKGSPGNSEFENDTGVIGRLFDDPNTLWNARGRLFFDRAYAGKVAGFVQGPFGLQFSSVIKYWDGSPFGRRLVIEGLSQGTISVMATPRGQPGGLRTQFHLTFDQRIAREFQLRRVKLSVFIDTFNFLNLKQNLREWDISGPEFPLRRPIEVQNPRVIRLGIRLQR